MQGDKRSVDEIDAWAERTFGKRVPVPKRVRVRNGLKDDEGKREFDKLFKGR